ncbi:hypothetical protein, partial [Tahibacter caeni]|uniref:hypothetical protein n=1 Tax=Tahibacter caeni TaxID=1453545 RepID=UPI0021489E96
AAGAVLPVAAHEPAVAVVSYEQLGAHLGEDVVVRTTLGSRRAGKLVRYSRAALRLQLAPHDGGVEFDIPSSSVRDAEVVAGADTPPGGDSAQKN